MAANFLNQENTAIANEVGIVRLNVNRQQRFYYPIHLRRFTQLLQWIMLINVLLLGLLFYLIFSADIPGYYATSFNGVNTRIWSNHLEQAKLLTQQRNTQGPQYEQG